MIKSLVSFGVRRWKSWFSLFPPQDIDELVERLTPGEIQRLLDECDPDDPHIPPSMRTNYRCDKAPTGPLDRQRLMDFINEQALNTPDRPEAVPYVPGTVRGKKWVAPPKPQPQNKLMEEEEEAIELDLGEEYEIALGSATTEEIVDLAGILGLHSMMNQVSEAIDMTHVFSLRQQRKLWESSCHFKQKEVRKRPYKTLRFHGFSGKPFPTQVRRATKQQDEER